MMTTKTIAIDYYDVSSWPKREDILEDTNDSSYPYPTMIKGLKNNRYELIRPISVDIYNINGIFYVADSIFYVWGSGETEEEAESDYEANLIDEYETLVENKDCLTKAAEEQFSELKSYLVKLN